MGISVVHNYPLPVYTPNRHLPRQSLRILSVDFSGSLSGALENALDGLPHELLPAVTMADALAILARTRIDLVVLHLAKPYGPSLELCSLLKRNPATQFLPVFALGSRRDPALEVRALDAGADEFVWRPLRALTLQARIRARIGQQSRVASLDDSETVIFSLAQSVEDRDPDLGQHCHRLALMAAAMGLSLGLPAEDILALERGGYLHDVGKVGVPDQVLFKPGPLTPAEWETMKAHTERGERICQGMKSLRPVLPIIRHHHEKWDGSGYPDGLRGDQIPLLARILQLADIYDALTTARPYKAAMPPDEAMQTIREEARRGWRDPRLVEEFENMLPALRSAPLSLERSHSSLHALAQSVAAFSPVHAKHLQLASGF